MSADSFLTTLRRVNFERYVAWVGDSADAGILFDAAELGGEVGELLNVVKKLEREARGWRGSRAAPEDFADECADVLICLDKLARRMDVDLEAATIRKFNATSDKVGLPQRLSATPAPSDQDASPSEGEIQARTLLVAHAYRVGFNDGRDDDFNPDACVARMGDPTLMRANAGVSVSNQSDAYGVDQDASQAQGGYRARKLHADVIPGFVAVVDGPDGWPVAHCAQLSEAERIAAALSPTPGATAQDGEYTVAASNEAFLDAIHKATPTGQWIAVQHAPDGSGWSVALHPLPWLPGGEVAVKAGHENTEADAIALFEHLNCPACGGSGHIGDTTPTIPAGSQQENDR